MLLLSLTSSLLVLVLGSVCAEDEKIPTYPKIAGGKNLSNFRWSRSAPAIAKPAIKALIKSAVEVPTKSPKFRKFIKPGSFEDALADFKKLKPTFITRKGFSLYGPVGDAKVKLKLKDHTHCRRPTIMIKDDSGFKPFKIIYTKKDDKAK